jgi:hypothetical protein
MSNSIWVAEVKINGRWYVAREYGPELAAKLCKDYKHETRAVKYVPEKKKRRKT